MRTEQKQKQNEYRLGKKSASNICGLVSIFVIGNVLLWPLKHELPHVCRRYMPLLKCVKRGTTQISQLKYYPKKTFYVHVERHIVHNLS